MLFEVGKELTCFLRDNPTNYITFLVKELDDLIVKGEVKKVKGEVNLWEVYEIKYQEGNTSRKVELAPYSYDEKKNLIKFLILGNVKEKRRFVRYKVAHLNIEVEVPGMFRGYLDDISVGGCKINILEYEKLPEPYNELTVIFKIGNEEYPVEIFPINVTEKFINAMFLGDNIQSSLVFNKVMSILNPKDKSFRERRIYRRFYTDKVPLYVDLPFGYGKVLDVSLKGAKIKLLKLDIDVEPRAYRNLLLEFYFLGNLARYLTRGKIKTVHDNIISVEFTRLNESVVELIKDINRMIDRGANIRAVNL